MSINVNEKTYRKLIEEDIAWLDTMPNCLESRHIKEILRKEANIPIIEKETEESVDTIAKSIFNYWCEIPPLKKGTILCVFDDLKIRKKVAKKFKTYPTHLEKSDICEVTDGDRKVIFYCPHAERLWLCDDIKMVVFISCCYETIFTMTDALKYSFENKQLSISFINM